MIIVALEGIDRSGKQTQAKMLSEWFRERSYKVLEVSFPRYDKPIGGLIRQWLDKKIEFSPEAVHMLYEADRVDWQEELQKAKKENVDVVIIDRYTMSNEAFGIARQIGETWLKQLAKPVQKADITFLLDLPAEVSHTRRGGADHDRLEEDLKFQDYVAGLYRVIARLDKKSCIIDATQTSDQMSEEIRELFQKRFKNFRRR